MTLGGAALPRRATRPVLSAVAVAGLAAVISLAAGRLVAEPHSARLAVTGCAVLLAFALAVGRPAGLLVGTVVWLAILGVTRRLLVNAAPAGSLDSLLLIGPAALGLLALLGLQRRSRHATRLSQAVAVLAGLTLLGALNPLQGSIRAGFAGLLFVFVPMLGFWIGRGLCDDRRLRCVVGLVAVISVLAAVYGLWQTLRYFPWWDRHWIATVNLDALSVSGVTRPFSVFSSPSEYGTYLAIGIVLFLTAALKRPLLRLVSLATVPLLAVALAYESSRGLIFLAVVAIGLVLAAWKRLPLAFAGAAAVGLLFLVPIAVRFVAPSSFSSNATGTLVAHQVQGLANPFNSEASTGGIHLNEVIRGLKSAFTHPVGFGVSTVTIAGSKFGGLAQGTEADPSNVSVALGLPGLLAYIAVVGYGFTRLYGLASDRGDLLSLAALALVAVTFLQWLNGGQYSVAFLPWLVMGWADAAVRRPRSLSRRGVWA